MATLAVQASSPSGITPDYNAAGAGGDEFVNDGSTKILVKNGGGVSINVTVDSQGPCNQGFDHDLVVAVGAGAEKEIGPFDRSRFNDANGKVQLTYSGITTVTISVVSVV